MLSRVHHGELAYVFDYFVIGSLFNVCQFKQVEFVRQLSAEPSNIVFALNRSPSAQLDELKESRSDGGKNIHVIKADIEDNDSLKVCLSMFRICYRCKLNFWCDMDGVCRVLPKKFQKWLVERSIIWSAMQP